MLSAGRAERLDSSISLGQGHKERVSTTTWYFRKGQQGKTKGKIPECQQAPSEAGIWEDAERDKKPTIPTKYYVKYLTSFTGFPQYNI